MCRLHSKTDDPPRVQQYTVQELSYHKHKNWKKKKSLSDGTSAWNHVNDVWATWESHRYAYRWHVGKRRFSAFPTPRINNKSTTEQISANWDVADQPRSGRPRKTTPREDRFLTTSSRRNRILSSKKLGRVLRNAIGTRVCDRRVRNKLQAARLRESGIGYIPLTWQNYRACCCTILTAGNHVTQQQKEWPTFEEIPPFQVRKSSIIPLIRDRLEFGLKQRRRKDSGDLLDVLDFLNNTW